MKKNKLSIGEILPIGYPIIEKDADVIRQLEPLYKFLPNREVEGQKILWLEGVIYDLDKRVIKLNMDQWSPKFLGLFNMAAIPDYYDLIKELPACIGDLEALQELNIQYNKLTDLPGSLKNLRSLRVLDLNHNILTKLPDVVFQLKYLEKLDVSCNHISVVDNHIADLPILQELNLGYNRLRGHSPEDGYAGSVFACKQLRRLNLVDAGLGKVDQSIGELAELEYLDLSQNDLKEIPDAIGDLKSIKELRIGYNHIETLPDFLHELLELEILDIQWLKIDKLPEFLYEMPKLKIIYMRRTDTMIPPGLERKVIFSIF